MDDVLDYHKRCDEWTNEEAEIWMEAKSRAANSLKKWREQECSVFVPLPDFSICLRT
jgi:exoribonuclease II